jgi:hypothetical protein
MMSAKVQAGIALAREADRKAKATGHDQDYESASLAWARAAHASHLIGVEAGLPKATRDRGFRLGVKMNKFADERRKHAEQIRHEAYTQRKERWSSREKLANGKPPDAINVLDQHGGFTAVTMPHSWAAHLKSAYRAGQYLNLDPRRSSVNGNTVWRPASLLKKGTTGKLVDFATNGFYQMNDSVTVAVYKVPGYAHPVAVWFDNATGKRIA